MLIYLVKLYSFRNFLSKMNLGVGEFFFVFHSIKICFSHYNHLASVLRTNFSLMICYLLKLIIYCVYLFFLFFVFPSLSILGEMKGMLAFHMHFVWMLNAYFTINIALFFAVFFIKILF